MKTKLIIALIITLGIFGATEIRCNVNKRVIITLKYTEDLSKFVYIYSNRFLWQEIIIYKKIK